ncbi:MAG: DUF456 family protein [Planctomycetota bacterium]|nr:DUF456 family protein [Planctomycetota bacterium]
MIDLTYYLLATLAVLVSILLWLTNLLTLPGNWGIPIVALGLAWGFPIDAATDGPGIGWDSVGVLFGLALLGEVLEFVAGAAGAAKQGASRRAIALSLVGSFVVSLLGAVLLGGLIPIVGALLGAVLGGGAGAWCGAYLGEMWKGRSAPERMAAGRGAVIGRVLGTVSKLLVGAVMIGVISAAAFI